MPSLAGTKTEKNLKEAFSHNSQANRRYLYFALTADAEGYNDIGVVIRSTAESKTDHAFGLLQFLEHVGGPTTGKSIDSTPNNLGSAIAAIHVATDMYPGMARTARDEFATEAID